MGMMIGLNFDSNFELSSKDRILLSKLVHFLLPQNHMLSNQLIPKSIKQPLSKFITKMGFHLLQKCRLILIKRAKL